MLGSERDPIMQVGYVLLSAVVENCKEFELKTQLHSVSNVIENFLALDVVRCRALQHKECLMFEVCVQMATILSPCYKHLLHICAFPSYSRENIGALLIFARQIQAINPKCI